MKKLLVTGSAGLIGSEVCYHFHALGWEIYGIDNNQRFKFFGKSGDTLWNQKRLKKNLRNYNHYNIDVRHRDRIISLIGEIRPDAVIHTAAQPSHDKASSIPFDDFDINAVGTLNLLESLRRYSVSVPFIHMSTNKVYGDAPNHIKLKELEKRWEYDDLKFLNGISEDFTIDQSKHSLFGASKVASDIIVQEYGRYFNMPTVSLRGGCLTGPNHAGVELHGFLSYLIKCNIQGIKYKIFGYKGKQVRDSIHAYDVVKFMEEFIKAPRNGEVYNLGGGKENSCSIWEAFDIVEGISGKKMIYEYIDKNREGDHICYYSNLMKIKTHYPAWRVTISIRDIFKDICKGWEERNVKYK